MELVTLAKLWLAIRPIKRIKEHRKAKRAARERGEIINQEETTMDIQAFVTQAVLAAIRHGLTAAGAVGILGSTETMAQIAGVVALIVGGAWSLWRKWSAAKKPV
jgi:hypothetical protein